MSTIDQMVQEDPWAEEPPRRRHRRWWLPTLAVFVILATAGYVSADHYTAGLYAIAPGEARPVAAYIKVPPDLAHKHPGKILLVTVALLTVKPYSWIGDKLNSDIELLPGKALTGNSPPSQLNQVNAVEMQTSAQTAVIVALRRLGYKIDLTGTGAEVDQVVSKSPADGHLVAGDVVLSIAGTPTLTNDALVTAVRARRAGEQVQMTVQNVAGKSRTETITLGQSPPDATNPGPSHAFLGIATSTKQQPKLPINVVIDADKIGGPSAGLSFTLGVIDNLTGGDLTGGKTIAVTGTINPDGSVGDVGGVAQKTVAVRNAGAVAFLVPPAEYPVAMQHAGSHLKIIKVATLEDALTALKSLGGDTSTIGPPPAAAAA